MTSLITLANLSCHPHACRYLSYEDAWHQLVLLKIMPHLMQSNCGMLWFQNPAHQKRKCCESYSDKCLQFFVLIQQDKCKHQAYIDLMNNSALPAITFLLFNEKSWCWTENDTNKTCTWSHVKIILRNTNEANAFRCWSQECCPNGKGIQCLELDHVQIRSCDEYIFCTADNEEITLEIETPFWYLNSNVFHCKCRYH